MQATYPTHLFSQSVVAQAADQKGVVTTRRLLWLYCVLWLFEGAVRKWVLPQFSLVILLVRDPVVLVIYYSAVRARIFPTNSWMTAFWIISVLLGVESFFHLFTSNMPPDVIAFGFRTFVLHMPLIWVVPSVVGRKELLLIGKWVLFLAPFLAGLMVIQFGLPKDHWLNAASLKGGMQIDSAMGKIRPAGFFSFIQGPVNFFALCLAVVFGGILQGKLFPQWLMAGGVVSTLAALSVSGSRGMLLGCFVVFAFGAVAALRSGKRVGSLMGLIVIMLASFAMLSQFEILRSGREIMEARWTTVGGDEQPNMTGSRAMAERYGGVFASAVYWAGEAPLFGYGAGSSSNLALERTGYAAPVETEWERVIYEMGPLTSSFYLLFRAALASALVIWGFQALRVGNYFCLVLASACFLEMLTGQFKQVTAYGYCVVCCGLTLAALKAFGPEPAESEPGQVATVDIGQSPVLKTPRLRGRGRFAVGGERVRS